MNPGDEVIVFDPYFVMYERLDALVGGKAVLVDTYPDFRIDLDRVARRDHAAHQGDPLQQPGQSDRRGGRAKPRSAAWPSWPPRRNVVLISDEIYRGFCYDRPFVSPAKYNDQTLVIDGFSKSARR